MSKLIQLTQGKAAIVDDSDFEWLNQWKWCYHKVRGGAFVQRKKERRSLLMHRLITNAPANRVVDHIDGNPLNNQRGNLRICTRAENSRNKWVYALKCRPRTSQYKGVCFNASHGKWHAQIGYNYGKKCLGYYTSELEAAHAYDAAARKLHGAFARTNF